MQKRPEAQAPSRRVDSRRPDDSSTRTGSNEEHGLTRCTWISSDLAEPLACALPATIGGYCAEHARDVATERAMDARAEHERDLIRAIYAQRAAGRSLEHLRPYLAAWFGGLIRRRIATALVTGETLDREHAHELGAILVALPTERAMAAARGIEAGVFRNCEIACETFRVSVGAVHSAMDVLGIERPAEHESQRAMVAGRIANMVEGRPPETASIEAVSQDAAADLLNVDRAIALDGVPVAMPREESLAAANAARLAKDSELSRGNDCPTSDARADRTTKNLRAILRAPEVVQELAGGAP